MSDKNLTVGVTIDVNNRDASQKLKGVNNDLQALGKSGQQVTGVFSRMGPTIAAGIAGLSITQIARDMVKLVAETQNLDTRIRSLTTSTSDYAKEQAFLTELARRHHKELLNLSDSYAAILSLEKSGLMTRQQGIGLLEGMSNATSALGASSEQLKQVMFGLSQALSTGTVRAEEFNQVTEPLPGLLQAMEKAAGLSAGGLRKLVNDGQVTSAFFLETLLKALREFDGAAARTGANLTAKFTDISNAYTSLAKALDKPLTNTLSPFLDAISGSLERLTAVIKRAKGEGLALGDVPSDLLQRTGTRGQPLGLSRDGNVLIQPGTRGLSGASGAQPLSAITLKAVAGAIDAGPSQAAQKSALELAEAQAKQARNLQALASAYEKQILLEGKETAENAKSIAMDKAKTDAIGWTASVSKELATVQSSLAEKVNDLELAYRLEAASLGLSAREAAGLESAKKLLVETSAKGLAQLMQEPAQIERAIEAGRQDYDLRMARAEAQRQLNQSIDDFNSRQAIANNLTKQADRSRRELDTLRGLQGRGLSGVGLQREMGIKRQLMDVKQRFVDSGSQGEDLAARMAEAERNIRATEAANWELNQSLNDTNDLGHELGMTFSSAFEDAIMKGGDFRSILAGVLQDIERIIIRTQISEPFTKWISGADGGGIGGFFSGLFGGGSSTGSQVTASLGGNGTPLDIDGMGFESMGITFANGGIMSNRGSLPLHRYASGGIANTPQLAMFGEGRMPEAYVPLPDGRSIPVSMQGGGTTVQVIDQRQGGAAAEVQRETGPSGMELIKVFIRDEVQRSVQPAMRTALASGTLDRDFAGSYGLRRTGR